MTTRYCVNCVHVTEKDDWYFCAEAYRRSLETLEVSLVTGKKGVLYWDSFACDRVRDDTKPLCNLNNTCGTSGRWFERAEKVDPQAPVAPEQRRWDEDGRSNLERNKNPKEVKPSNLRREDDDSADR